MQLGPDKLKVADSKDGGHELNTRDGDWLCRRKPCLAEDEVC